MSSQESIDSQEKTVTVGRAPHDSTNSDDLSGSIFAQKYEVLELLGKGGMSVVYRARHIGMDKIVALKILHKHLSKDELSLKRFKQEAQAASTLTHPSIVAIHDCDESDGSPYLVMDYVEGICLSDLIKSSGTLALDRFLAIMQAVAAGLAHAHQAGIVHRDLKPSNIIVTNAGGKDKARIVDFGIAKVLTQTGENAQQLTQTGEVFGSPLYMSPEQCRGAQVDKRADIYSFACLMYEALCGKAPFKGESVFETINKHLNEAPPPLRATQLEEDSRIRIELMLLKALAKDPDHRQGSVTEIENELRKLTLRQKSGLLNSLGCAWELASAKRRASRKNRLPLLVITLTTVSCLSVASVLLLMGGLHKANREIARLEQSRLMLSEISLLQSDFIALGEAARIFFTAMFVDSDKLEPALKKLELRQKITRERLDKVETALLSDPKLLAKFKTEMKPTLIEIPKKALIKLQELAKEAQTGSMNPSQVTDSMYLAGLCSKGSAIVRGLSEQAKEVEAENMGQFKHTELWISYLSYLCASMNSIVVVVLILYFARGTPQKLKKLARQASQLSRRRGCEQTNALKDEIQDLDSVLHELASALSEAEERERLLIEKLKENAKTENQSEA